MSVSPPPARYPDDLHRPAFVRRTLDRIGALPGVRSASVSLSIPKSIGVIAPFLAEGQPPAPVSQRPMGEWKAITPAYFQTMGVPLVRGRAFTWSDDTGPPASIPSRRPAGAGTALGGVLWAISDEVAVPALHLSKGPREYPLRTHAIALASHLVYGVTTELARRLLRSGVLSR